MATIRITSKGTYAILLDEPHPIAISATFTTLTDAVAYCMYQGIKFVFGWE